jgi:RND family efflux transporter MFP subunit
MKRWVLITLALGALIIGYRQLRSTTKGWFGTDDTISATGTPVNRELMPPVVRERGRLQAVEVVDVFSPVAGHLNKVQFKAGDKVVKGQTLATVRSDELLQRVEKIAAALEAAKADLRQKESRLAEAEKVLDRAHELHSRDLIPGRDLKEAEAARDTARAQQSLTHAQVAAQQAALEQTRYLLSVAKVVAPFNGVVTRRLADSGVYVQASTPIFSVGALELLQLVIEIAERDVHFVRKGVAAQIRADALPGRVFAGQVTALIFDSKTTQKAVAEVQLSNRDRLLFPGMIVEVTVGQNSQ